MKNILLFNDFSPHAEHAGELALLLAAKTNASLYVWDTFDYSSKIIENEVVISGENEIVLEVRGGKNSWIEKLESKLNWQTGLTPAVHFIEGIDFAPDNVLGLVRKYDAGLLIKGIAENEDSNASIEADILSCSTKSGCPVLLVPEKFPNKAFEKIVYATDLRFCRKEVIRFLSKYANVFNASVLVANMSAKGMPPMDDQYALSVFKDEIIQSLHSENIYFSNIRERDIPKAIEVLINGMNNDLLVLVNHKYHFNELLGRELPHTVPDNIRVPLLIFPS